MTYRDIDVKVSNETKSMLGLVQKFNMVSPPFCFGFFCFGDLDDEQILSLDEDCISDFKREKPRISCKGSRPSS
jgi:hypothetical protein